MKNELTSVLIISNANRLCTSLRVLLRANSEIEWIGEAPNAHTALELIAVHQPEVVLIDAGLANDEAWQALKMIKSAVPLMQCVILSHSTVQQKIAARSRADAVLGEDFSTKNLFQLLRKTVL